MQYNTDSSPGVILGVDFAGEGWDKLQLMSVYWLTLM